MPNFDYCLQLQDAQKQITVSRSAHTDDRLVIRLGEKGRVAWTLQMADAVLLASLEDLSAPLPAGMPYMLRNKLTVIPALHARRLITVNTNLDKPKGLVKFNITQWKMWWKHVCTHNEYQLSALGTLVARAIHEHLLASRWDEGLLPWFDLDDDRVPMVYQDYSGIFGKLLALGLDVSIVPIPETHTRLSIYPNSENYWLRSFHQYVEVVSRILPNGAIHVNH
jgi:hypothetical protein